MNTDNQEPNTEQRILLAAEEVFLAKGYDSARTTEIAQKAGVTHAMQHYYYRTKAKLFDEFLKSIADEAVRTLEIPFADEGNTSFIDRIVQGALAHFDFVMRHRQLPRFLLLEISYNEELRDQFFAVAANKARKIIPEIEVAKEKALIAGEIEDIDVNHLLMDIAALNLMTALSLPVLFQSIFRLQDPDELILQCRAEVGTLIRKRLSKI